jgi:glycosyltransferase involved in cell wall biosynthesis
VSLVREGIEVVHEQFAAPLLCPSRIVVTLYDIAYERYPAFLPKKDVAKLRWAVPLTIRRAASILAISEFTKQEIVRRYRVSPDRIVVAPCACTPLFRPLRDEARLAAIRARYDTGDHFVLFVGDPLQRRKNVTTLVDAYVRLRQADAIRHRLVLSGHKDVLHHEIFATVRNTGYAEELRFVGRVEEDDLVALYNAADVFVYPSLYEGFGLPPLEAMACGTPVVTSTAASLPEVVGDAAMMVDPLDVEALATAIATIVRDPSLQSCLSAQGVQRAATFTWDATARIVAGVYRTAMHPRKR